MLIPTVDFCILCEGVRPEPNGKANILGFYGVLPSANIIIQELRNPVSSLIFLVGLRGPGDAGIGMAARIIAPDESTLVDLQPELRIKLQPVPASMGALAGIGFAGLVFNQEGTYTVELIIENTKAYRGSFTIRQGAAI